MSITHNIDLKQVGGFSWVLPVSSTNNTDYHDMTEILLKVALNTNYDTPAYMLVYFISFCNELTPTYRVQSQTSFSEHKFRFNYVFVKVIVLLALCINKLFNYYIIHHPAVTCV